MFDGQIDRMGERENLPKEILFKGEKELLKRIHEIKKELKETEWSESSPPKVTQPSFLRTDLGEDEVSFNFESQDIITRLSIIIDDYFINCSIFEARCMQKPLRIIL